MRQHPAAHDNASQTHTPLAQRRPGPHAGPAPHAQRPVLEHDSALIGSQATQVLAEVPQVFRDRAWQRLPLQHPDGQDSGVHWQVPATHWVPGPHGGPAPQAHAPAMQWSAVRVSQARHWPDRQHPCAQPASHVQLPARQTWPWLQAGPAPQEQAPLVHASAVVSLHDWHATPLAPHVAVVGLTHVLPEQHPPGQVCALQLSHTPLVHSSPGAQVSHVLPALPHDWGVVPVLQTLSAQHPDGQNAGVQRH